MCPLMLGPVRGVTESLFAPVLAANIRPLAGVRPHMNFEVLQARESFCTSFVLRNIIFAIEYETDGPWTYENATQKHATLGHATFELKLRLGYGLILGLVLGF